MEHLSKGGTILDYFGKYDSPLGPLLLISDGQALTGLYMNREIPLQIQPLPVFRQTELWLDAYFRGEKPEIRIPMNLRGTAFQKWVWARILDIPYGKTVTYGEIAREMAVLEGKEKMSAQAVGQAVGKNPVSILIPCHRVVGAGGKLTGYGGGMENKVWLLRHEGWQIRENDGIQQRSG